MKQTVSVYGKETANLDLVSDFLTPEQRLEIVADILSTIALRVIEKQHESNLL